MTSYFDHRFGSYDGMRLIESELNESKQDNPSLLSIPRYSIHKSYMPNLMKDGRKALLGFRDVAR